MYGTPLRLSLKRHSTKSYILKEVNGTYFLGGHVGHFFDEFAKYHNAIIEFPTGYLNALSFDGFLDNDTLDISQQLSVNRYESDRAYSDCYTYLDWCIMVPTASLIQKYMFYGIIFDIRIMGLILATILLLAMVIAFTFWLEGKATHLLDTVFNIYIFNGMLGQPYQMEPHFSGVRSILYMLICLGGIMINTTYVTYLQSFNANPPTEKPAAGYPASSQENSNVRR
uniref:Ionotropic glutamate receptor C-terminal domain-containing protein n=1 Tax=Musca domestica TaxID=7370 RepID=A0A1I8NIU9_MUSDO